jgi:hypothetical protein
MMWAFGPTATRKTKVMSQQPFKIDVSQRISRLPPYLFGRINKMKYEKRVAGVDIIDLGMGNPTDPTPKCVVDKLGEAAMDPRNHRYSVSNGIAGLRREVAVKYKEKYGVELDPETEVIATIARRKVSATCAWRCSARATPLSSRTRVPDPHLRRRHGRRECDPRAAGERSGLPRPLRAGHRRLVPQAQDADPQLPAQPDRDDDRPVVLGKSDRDVSPARGDDHQRLRLRRDQF